MMQLAQKVINLQEEFAIAPHKILVVVSEKRARDLNLDHVHNSYLLPYRVKFPIELTKKFVEAILQLEEDMEQGKPNLISLASAYSSAMQNFGLKDLSKEFPYFQSASKILSLIINNERERALESEDPDLTAILSECYQINTPPKHISKQLKAFVLDRAEIFFSTLSGSMSPPMTGRSFNVVVVDEAAQASEAELTCVLKEGVKSVILVGDPRQLEVTVFSDVCKSAGYGRSLFARLESLGHPLVMLNVQYRMHPLISTFPSEQFYEGAIEDGTSVDHRWKEFPTLEIIQHQKTTSAINSRGSSSNLVEAEFVCMRLVLFLKSVSCVGVKIGIVCPYTAQKDLLEAMVKKIPSAQKHEISVNTIDGFQGQERDIIILSLTKAKQPNVGRFLVDPHRVNVALTRAKYKLWVFGDENIFTHGLWWKFFDHCRKTGQITTPSPVTEDLLHVVRKISRTGEEFCQLEPGALQSSAVHPWKLIFSESVFKKLKESPEIRYQH
jgi:hypothetical protein